MTTKRPSITRSLTLADFEGWYWLRTDLVLLCRTFHLSTTGTKLELEDRLKDTRLLRHANSGGRSAYELWREDCDAFRRYQSVQSIEQRRDFGDAAFWASFASTMDGETVFLGLYHANFKGVGEADAPKPHTSGTDLAGTYHLYEVTEAAPLRDLAGRLFIDWGAGTRSWIQRADKQSKPITELRRTIADPDFPGFVSFIATLLRVEAFPRGWVDALRSVKGVYLLTCPRTREQYVGKADEADGFLGRWLHYAVSGHGGNVELKAVRPATIRSQSSRLPARPRPHTTSWRWKIAGRKTSESRDGA